MTKHSIRRRRPRQERAQATVEAILAAAIKLLERNGVNSITTNRIAETAGASIGSVYQYFPNKGAIYVALHGRHIENVDRVIRQKISESSGKSLEVLVASLLDGMLEIHEADPGLSRMLDSEVPHRADGTHDFSMRHHRIFRNALELHTKEVGGTVKLDLRAFLLGNMLDAFGHALVLRRPRGLSLHGARKDVCRAIVASLRS
jgi:AcrR family transcriptional regulator